MLPPRLDDLIGPGGETREWLILASIRAGGYPHVAAAAYGVPAQVFTSWLRRGRRRKAPAKYRRLWLLVSEASGRARLKAEMGVYEADIRFWLRHGPGKETRHAAGWSAPPRAVFEADGLGETDLLGVPQVQALVAALLRALEAFPEARVAAADAISRLA
jgi:hypothetical protein